ncbi:putative RNA polymerase, sigma 70 family subunit [Anaeromyxobacter dehalogenans 2CP-1]|uniref:RNA polymerase sigma factor n=1 Tax=Anaeromyxobacter dehalogenans (strain ATCC BAA-258 / DSM 21875 / 2CP-1) TaxID=455488 RepID=B8JFV4_ANAD2|nr:RNA polymerase factor sigma-32 [Anaeromyxobacter dehalogenans]ACL64542.1 putative RNA polymerase, sigma 70 family subunit [Anaeromyxobacter dehalogenans 2CP-1]
MNRPSTASSTLDQYLREINRVALLTVEEERRLARQFRDEGNTRAGHRLVEANLRFVVKVAFEYRSYGLRMADLIQEGNIGLMKAVQKFDPDKEIRLISYAVWWIRAYIQNHILKSWSLVKIGTTQAQRKLFFSLARTRHEIERLTPGAGLAEEGIDVALVAKKLRVRPSDVVEMTQRMEGRDLSLDAPVADGTSTHLEFTPADGEPQDEELARAEEDALLARRVSEAMGRLDPRERHIVEARIMGEGKETLRDLGHHFGFSRERARQLEIRALEKLRRDLEPVADEIGWPVTGAEASAAD